MDESKGTDAILQLALHALSLASANTMLLRRKGMLPDEEAKELADIFRECAGLFEGVGNDKAASRLWTSAAVLDGTARKG